IRGALDTRGRHRVNHDELSVEDERLGVESTDRGHQLREPMRVVSAVPADQAEAVVELDACDERPRRKREESQMLRAMAPATPTREPAGGSDYSTPWFARTCRRITPHSAMGSRGFSTNSTKPSARSSS